MLKIYQDHPHSGGSAELWEENWLASRFSQSLRFCHIDPLRPIFEKYVKPGSRMLEGGCGLGQYVVYYTLKGVNVVGLDFAQRALSRLNKRASGLTLCAGDVSRLPFEDCSFDSYYSGGVVEHFESGPENALSEASRVLKNDGILMISVPYFSPLRRALLPLKRNIWKAVARSESEPSLEGLNFFQYAYTTREFENLLNAANLRVVETQGYAVIWGLYELPFATPNSEVASASSNEEASGSNTQLFDVNEPVQHSLLRRLVVSEDDTPPILGLGVKFMRWFSANMMMYVCVKK